VLISCFPRFVIVELNQYLVANVFAKCMFLFQKTWKSAFFSVNCVFKEKYQPLVLGFFFSLQKDYFIFFKSLMEIYGRIVQS
jgi:hypothetical protein